MAQSMGGSGLCQITLRKDDAQFSRKCSTVRKNLDQRPILSHAGMEANMALKVELKPGERMILGECVITNADQRTRLLIDGAAPILREKDIMTAELADTPAKRIYLTVQLMYIGKDPQPHHELYFGLIRDIVRAAPSMWPYVEAINHQILTGDLYKALKEAKKLVAYERECLANASGSESLRQSRPSDGEPA